ncbi:MAG: polyprenyl synthetase family protein [Actinobacteria bacterium]|nr:polyprenyl synthetase family protein [Actinomycetota bacterium]
MDIINTLNLKFLEENLVNLEKYLKKVLTTDSPFMDEIATHLLNAGGKRLRPTLTLACGTCQPAGSDPNSANMPSEVVLAGAAAVELIHLGSLYHDDVMDEALSRRGIQSVNSRWGNLSAIIAGDMLLAKSAELGASLGSDISALLAVTLGELCKGQMEEVRLAHQTTRSYENYFKAISGKTAYLMGTACRIGALLAKMSRDQVETVTNYGHNFGIAFQIKDDVMDIIGTEAELGKRPGQDLAEGVYTLPVLFGLKDKEIGAELGSLLGKPLDQLADQEGIDKIRALITSSPAIKDSVIQGLHYVKLAGQAGEKIQIPELRDALISLADALMQDLPKQYLS